MTPVERDRGPTSETMRRRVLDTLAGRNGAPHGPKPNPYLADPPVYCDHGYVLPWADHPAAGVESCPHWCTEKRA